MILLRNLRLISYLFLVCLFTVYVSFSFAGDRQNSKCPAERFDFFLPLSDGVKLDCSKFIPDLTPPEKGFPCLIYCHGFGRNKEDNLDEALKQSQYGFYTLCYSMRGQGESGGFTNLISTTEMNDLLEVILYVKNEAMTNGDRIGVFGSSQGGIIPLMAACYGAGIRCVISDLGSPEFATSWIENGCIKTTFLWSLSYGNSIVRYNEQVKQYREWALSDDKSAWENLSSLLPAGRNFLDRVKDLKVPVIVSNAWKDKFFNPLGNIKSIPFLNVPYRMYFGSVVGHGGDAGEQEKIFHENFIDEWINYWLGDRQNMVLEADKFVYAATSFSSDNSSTFTRFESPVWPPSGINDMKFYFRGDNRLSTSADAGSYGSTVNFLNDVRDMDMKTIQAVNYGFKGYAFESGFRKTEISFDSEPLEREYVMVGTSQVYLHYSSDADICQFNFQIWEVMQDEESRVPGSPAGFKQGFITSVNFTDRNYAPNTVKETLIDGESFGHIFKKGSRIRIILTNLDTRPGDKFLRTYPFVLPVLKRAHNTIYTGSDNPSYIILPLL